MLIIQLLCICYYQLFSGWQNVYVPTCMYVRVCARLCSFVECWGCQGTEAETFPRVLSGRRLYAAERTEKGEGISGLFVLLEKPTFHLFFAHTPLPLNVNLMVSLAFTMKQSLILQVKMRGHRTLPLEARYVSTYSIIPHLLCI